MTLDGSKIYSYISSEKEYYARLCLGYESDQFTQFYYQAEEIIWIKIIDPDTYIQSTFTISKKDLDGIVYQYRIEPITIIKSEMAKLALHGFLVDEWI